MKQTYYFSDSYNTALALSKEKMDAMTGSFQPNSINPIKLLLQIISLFNDLNNMILFTELNDAYLNRKKKVGISRSYFYFLKKSF